MLSKLVTVLRWSVARLFVRRPLSSNIFSETTWPTIAKFHMEPQWDERTKVCSRTLAYITKLAATRIFVCSHWAD